MYHKIKSVVVFLKTIVTFVLSRPFKNIQLSHKKLGHSNVNQRGYAPTHSYLGNDMFCEYGTEIQYCSIHLPQLFVFSPCAQKKSRDLD